jgi:hypothetical protein
VSFGRSGGKCEERREEEERAAAKNKKINKPWTGPTTE